MNPFISVIIPVYNAARYVSKCIESVLAQTYPHWQLLLVDDGSIDTSLEICQSYAQRDSRITVLHQSNAGAGAARNLAIEKAVGEWIVFVDSDDYIANDYFALLLKHSFGNDLVFIDVLRISEGGNILAEERMSKYKNISKDSFIRYQLTGAINWGGVRKCVKTKLLRDYDIRYCHFKNGEEALLTFQELVNAKSYSFIEEKPVYYYVEHGQTLSSLPIPDPWGDAVSAIKEYALDNGLYFQFANTINAFNITATVVSIDRLSCQNKGKALKDKINARMRQFYDVFDSEYEVDIDHMMLKARIFVPLLTKGITWPITLLSKLRNLL